MARHIIVLRIESEDPGDEYDDGDLYRAIENAIQEVIVRGPNRLIVVSPQITSSSSAIF